MKTPVKTKEVISAELALSQDKVTRLKESDEYRRKEIAKAFGWYKKRGQYDYSDTEPRLPSWEEIFVELGRLLQSKDFNALQTRVDIIHREVEELRRNQMEPLDTGY